MEALYRYITLLFCVTCLFACVEDPTFKNEDVKINVNEYHTVGYRTVDMYCQIEANVSIAEVILQYSLTSDMKRAEEEIMTITKDAYPIDADFDKKNNVYHCKLNDLKDNTAYYCRIIINTPVENNSAVKEVQFSTLNLAESVFTLEATDVTLNAATLRGYYSVDSDITVSQCGFYYSTEKDMGSAIVVNGNYNNDGFMHTAEDLIPNKTYYFVAFISIDGQEYRGEQKEFITNDYAFPEVLTGEIEIANYVSAEVYMTLTNAGNTNISEAGICYCIDRGAMPEYGKDSTSIITDFTIGEKKRVKLNHLQDGTRYVYRAYAINAAGIVYGDPENFTTNQIMPIVISLSEAENIKWDTSNPSSSAWKVWATFVFEIHTYGQAISEYFLQYTDLNTSKSSKITFFRAQKASEYKWEDSEHSENFRETWDVFYGSSSYECHVGVVFIDQNGNQQTVLSDNISFSTPEYKLAKVTTNSATSVKTDRASVSMNVNDANTGGAVWSKGFKYSADQNCEDYDFENTEIWKNVYASSGNYTFSNLQSNTKYYYVAWALNVAGTAYGAVKTFTTKGVTAPRVQTYLEYNSPGQAKLGGYTDGGNETGVTVGFVYSSTTMEPTMDNATTVVVSTSFTENDNNEGLFYTTLIYTASTFSKNTPYYFRAFCTNSLGTYYGDVETFDF